MAGCFPSCIERQVDRQTGRQTETLWRTCLLSCLPSAHVHRLTHGCSVVHRQSAVCRDASCALCVDCRQALRRRRAAYRAIQKPYLTGQQQPGNSLLHQVHKLSCVTCAPAIEEIKEDPEDLTRSRKQKHLEVKKGATCYAPLCFSESMIDRGTQVCFDR